MDRHCTPDHKGDGFGAVPQSNLGITDNLPDTQDLRSHPSLSSSHFDDRLRDQLRSRISHVLCVGEIGDVSLLDLSRYGRASCS